MPRYLTPAGSFDRPAIMRAAWALARTTVEALAQSPYRPRVTTAREQFGQALRRIWDNARGERAMFVYAAESKAGAAAEAARRAALPDRDRRIEDAANALIRAEHADHFTAAHNLAVIAARAQLASLHATV